MFKLRKIKYHFIEVHKIHENKHYKIQNLDKRPTKSFIVKPLKLNKMLFTETITLTPLFSALHIPREKFLSTHLRALNGSSQYSLGVISLLSSGQLQTSLMHDVERTQNFSSQDWCISASYGALQRPSDVGSINSLH